MRLDLIIGGIALTPVVVIVVMVGLRMFCEWRKERQRQAHFAARMRASAETAKREQMLWEQRR